MEKRSASANNDTELSGKVPVPKKGLPEKTRPSGGRWFQVRIMPYRTLENRIDGVVITFADVTVSKTLEIELREARAELQRRGGARPGEPLDAGRRRRAPERRGGFR